LRKKPHTHETERETIRQLCLPTHIACQNLDITPVAWEWRVRRILLKFGVENEKALIIKAIKLGIVPVESFMYRNFSDGDAFDISGCRE